MSNYLFRLKTYKNAFRLGLHRWEINAIWIAWMDLRGQFRGREGACINREGMSKRKKAREGKGTRMLAINVSIPNL